MYECDWGGEREQRRHISSLFSCHTHSDNFDSLTFTEDRVLAAGCGRRLRALKGKTGGKDRHETGKQEKKELTRQQNEKQTLDRKMKPKMDTGRDGQENKKKTAAREKIGNR